jgi:hypothetical protein
MVANSVVFNHFPQLAKAMRLSVADVVFETAEGILDEAFATVSANSKRTGALADSGRTDYSDDGTKAIVGFDDFKAVWLEYGTGAPAATRAEPYLTPASEHHRSRFESALRSIEPRLRVNAAGSISVSGHSRPRKRR